MVEQLLSLRSPEGVPATARPEEGGAVLRVLQGIEGLLDGTAASWQRMQLVHERHWHRIPFREELTVTPIDELERRPMDERHEAVGCDISLGGISFKHAAPLPHRLVAVTFELSDGSTESLVTRLRWCRFGVDGAYRSGGVFMHSMELNAR
jgi:hypothetical protein